MRSARILLWCCFASAAPLLAQVGSFEERVALLFRPPLAEQMAISPDGRRIAYTAQHGEELHVVILDLENPRATVTLNVDNARDVAFSREKQPVQLRFLRWATADRLVLAPTPERIPLLTGDKIIAPIMAVGADGTNPMTLLEADEFAIVKFPEPSMSDAPRQVVSPTTVTPRCPIILGFARDNREQLVVRIPPGRDEPGEMIAVDVRTGIRTSLDRVPPTGEPDGRLPISAALRDKVQRQIAAKFPHRRCVLIDWSNNAQHVLERVTGGSDPGRVFVYQRPDNLVLELFKSAPWGKSDELNESRFIETDLPHGQRSTGYVTWPRKSRLKPPPLLVCFPSGFRAPVQRAFDPEAQVFADLGFVVLRLNQRVFKNDPDAVLAGLDRISVEDTMLLMKKLAALFPNRPFDPKHVAVFGRGFGGYLAMRALQLRPDVFRAGVAIDAPMDLEKWLYPQSFGLEAESGDATLARVFAGEPGRLAQFAVIRRIEALTRPVLFLVEPTRNAAVEAGLGPVRSQLGKFRRPVEYLEIEPGFRLGLPNARATIYRKIEEFFNLRLYDYRVKIGPEAEVK